MEVFSLVGRILIDSKDAENSISKTGDKASGLHEKISKGIKTFGAWRAAAVGGSAAVLGALSGVDERTKEYRENLNKLDAAYEASGKDSETAKKAYKDLYAVLGDSDQATEAAQLLAQLAEDEEDVSKWAETATGVFATFGDALPIEGLIEASNETAKLGTVTGVLADALNWVGISEDEFNEKLASLSTEQERNQLITETLNGTYSEAAAIYEENNAQILESRKLEDDLNESLAKLGDVVQTVKNGLMRDFLPSVTAVIEAFADFIGGTENAEEALSNSIEDMVSKAIEKLPVFLEFGIDIIVAIAKGLIKELPFLVSKAPEIILALIEGFLELGDEMFDLGNDLLSETWDGMKSVWENISSWVSDKVSWLANKLAFWRSAKEEMSEGDSDDIDGSHASGLNYVPYDGYVAQLHRGERVLTARENQSLMQDMINALNVINNPKQGVPICVQVMLPNGEKLAEAIFDDLFTVGKRRGVSLG